MEVHDRVPHFASGLLDRATGVEAMIALERRQNLSVDPVHQTAVLGIVVGRSGPSQRLFS